MAVGNVVVGRNVRKEGDDGGKDGEEGRGLVSGEEEDMIDLDDGRGAVADGESTREAVRRGEDVDAPLR